jgi:hypothetical protein
MAEKAASVRGIFDEEEGSGVCGARGALWDLNRVFIRARCPASGFENHELVRCAFEELNETQRRVIHLSHFARNS